MSTKKLLIAVGDSFTDPKLYSFIPKVWPEYVAELADWDHINLGKGGASNYYIFNKAIDAIEKYSDRDIIVIANWSCVSRINLFDITSGMLESEEELIKTFESKVRDKGVNVTEEYVENMRKYLTRTLQLTNVISQRIDESKEEDISLSDIYFKIVEHSLRTMYLLEEYCTLRGIEFYHFSAISPIADETFVKALTSHQKYSYQIKSFSEEAEKGSTKIKNESLWYKKLSESKKYMGFSWDGNHYIKQHNLIVNRNDHHPNHKGHELLGNLIHNFITNGNVESLNIKKFERPIYVYD